MAQVSGWLEFHVRWKAGVDRRQRITISAEAIRAHDALHLLLLPRRCSYRITGRAIEIAPLER